MPRYTSSIKPQITDAAISLFGLSGFNGVTTRDLAKKARVTEASIYRLFRSKQNLHKQTIEFVLNTSHSQMADALLAIYPNRDKKTPDQISDAILCWYNSLTQDGARLLLQIQLGRTRQKHQSPYDSILKLLSRLIEDSATSSQSLPAEITAILPMLLHSLLLFKITYSGSVNEEQQSIRCYLTLFWKGLGMHDQ